MSMSPGMLYVIATLLPLLSFVLLFLGGKRWPGKTGAYIAIGAIGGAFVCAAIGFITYLTESAHRNAHDQNTAAVSRADDHSSTKTTSPSVASTTKPDKKEHKAEHPSGAKKETSHTDHDHDKAHGEADHGHHEQVVWKGSFSWLYLTGFNENKGAWDLRLGYMIDRLGALMFLMVTFIASLIHIFATGYMGDELQAEVEDHQAHIKRKGRYTRFFMWFSLFSFSMLNLIIADNLLQIFVSWELVGVCSFGLIGFYYERQSASNAANKAFITNRVGDAGFIIGILIIWTYTGTLNFGTTSEIVKDADGDTQVKYQQISFFDVLRAPKADAHEALPQAGQVVRANPAKSPRGRPMWQVAEDGSHVVLWDKELQNSHFHGPNANHQLKPYSPTLEADGHGDPGVKTMPYWMLVLAGAGIFLGCVGKSAQFPLQVWLPDAMEGPTPVSALVHSATMVAAGVYLVGRVFPLFVPEVLLLIAYCGGITLFVAATIAIVQTDIKKVLAYSTVSQLGFMMLALGVGGWVAGLFHLLTHAFFKALLFLCSGSVIYGCHHEQEMTKMGGLHAKMKITSLTMLVGVLAICGTPLFTGWYSKDAILVSSLSFVSLNPKHFLLFLLPLITAGITAFYMFRLWFMTFTGKPRDEHVYEHAHESPWAMTIPLILLAICSVVVAWGPKPWEVQGSAMEHYLHHGQPASVTLDTGLNLNIASLQAEGNAARDHNHLANSFAKDSWLHSLTSRLGMGPHDLAGMLALLSAFLGVALAFVVYYWKLLDAAENKSRFAGLYQLFTQLWYFDHLYSALLVRPALVVGYWCRYFDATVIDGLIHLSARSTVLWTKLNGKFDLGIVDGMVNLTGKVIFGIGAWLKGFQTGFIRNYVLFMAVAAVGLFALLSYVIALAG